jgi:hypothetical protein
MRMETWVPFDSGRSLGSGGSEGGTIILDEEHVEGARITIERGGGTAPLSITCGIYGWMVHTRFFGTEPEARRECEKMKVALAEIICNLRRDNFKMAGKGALFDDFLERFP